MGPGQRARLAFGAAVALAALPQCRSTSTSNTMSEQMDAPKAWYDAAGNPGSCDAPSTAGCGAYKDEKTFADLCVAKGFMAKSCGCGIRCSGKVDMPSTGGAAVQDPKAAAAKPAAPAGGCPADGQAFINQVVANREQGSSLDRCIESHVCNGNFGWCGQADAQTTARLRTYGRQGCDTEIVGAFCKDGSLDSFRCPETDIQKLSKVWADLYSRDLTVKRCIRNFVCSDDKMLCGAADDLKLAQSVKASVQKDGCEYWLRVLCSIGAKSW